MLTELEEKIMLTIPKENFYEDGFDSALWTDCFIDTVKDIEGIDGKQTRGILSSLVKKEYIYISGGKDSILNLLQRGKAWLLMTGVVDECGYTLKK